MVGVPIERCPVCKLRVGVTIGGLFIAHYTDRYSSEHCRGSGTAAPFGEGSDRSARIDRLLATAVRHDSKARTAMQARDEAVAAARELGATDEQIEAAFNLNETKD